MQKMIRSAALPVAMALGLSACGGGGGSSPPASTTPTTPAPAAAFQDRFGTSFSTAFNASTTANAIDPASTDVPALNATAEPLDN